MQPFDQPRGARPARPAGPGGQHDDRDLRHDRPGRPRHRRHPGHRPRASPRRFLASRRRRGGLRPDRARGAAGGRRPHRGASSPPTCATPTPSTALVDGRGRRALGRLDVLVNNAGGSPPADSATASPRFSKAIIALNLLAPLVCAQRANAVMQTQAEGGSIVNIASVSGAPPVAGHRGLRRGQGRPAQPHPDPRGRVGAEGAGQRGDRRAHPHRAGAPPLRRRGGHRAPSARPSRSVAWRRPPTSPTRACSSRPPLAGYVSGRQPARPRRRRAARLPRRRAADVTRRHHRLIVALVAAAALAATLVPPGAAATAPGCATSQPRNTAGSARRWGAATSRTRRHWRSRTASTRASPPRTR